MTIGYTNEQVQELINCLKDPVHFIKNHIKIVHPTKGMIPFELHPFQKNLIETYHTGKSTVLCAPRQMGKTLVTCAYIIWYALFNVDKTVLIGSHSHSARMRIMEIIRQMISALPNGMAPKTLENNKHSVVFDNGCRIFTQPVLASSFSRGMAVDLYYFDEFAYIKNESDKDYALEILAMTHYRSQSIVSSTPNPDDTHFPELFEFAKDHPNYEAIKIRWDEFPGRGQEFKEQMIKYMSEAHWKAEYECEFINKETVL